MDEQRESSTACDFTHVFNRGAARLPPGISERHSTVLLMVGNVAYDLAIGNVAYFWLRSMRG